MDKELTIEQYAEASRALTDNYEKGYTDRKCPICGGALRVNSKGYSGVVYCDTEGCFGKINIRGL